MAVVVSFIYFTLVPVCQIADIVFSDGKTTSYLHVGNMVYTVRNHY